MHIAFFYITNLLTSLVQRFHGKPEDAFVKFVYNGWNTCICLTFDGKKWQQLLPPHFVPVSTCWFRTFLMYPKFRWVLFVNILSRRGCIWYLWIKLWCVGKFSVNPFVPASHFLYPPENFWKPFNFLMFPGGRERVHWERMS